MEILQSQLALITGASSGIGKEIAISLLKLKINLLLIGRNENALRELAAMSEGQSTVDYYVTDLSNHTQLYELLGSIKQSGKEPDIIIHSAGVFQYAGIEKTTDEMINYAFDLNFMAPFIITRELMGALIRKKGKVIFINSTVSLTPKANVSAYSASKAALKSFADVLHDEFSSLGVRVASIYPGRVATPMQETVCEMEGSAYNAEKFLSPGTIAQSVIHLLTLPENAEIRNLTIRQPR